MSEGSIHPTGVSYCKQLTKKKSSFQRSSFSARMSWFPNSVWEPTSWKLRFLNPVVHHSQARAAKRSFADVRSQTEVGNEKSGAGGGRVGGGDGTREGLAPEERKNVAPGLIGFAHIVPSGGARLVIGAVREASAGPANRGGCSLSRSRRAGECSLPRTR